MATTTTTIHRSWFLCILLLFVTALPGVRCDDSYSIGGLVAASGVAFIFLAVVIGMIVIGFTWNSWYPALQAAKGKIKMPRDYWKKREEAKRRLISGSTSRLGISSENGLPNGAPSSRVHDTDDNKSDKASWVQGWNNANQDDQKGYEEMALAMDLYEENDDEFRIETTVVDNEALDLGPFKDSEVAPDATSEAQPPAAPAPPAPAPVAVTSLPDPGPLATTTGVRKSTQAAASSGTARDSATLEMTEEPDEDEATDYLYSTVDKSRSATGGDTPRDEEAVTSFSKMDPDLVAF